MKRTTLMTLALLPALAAVAHGQVAIPAPSHSETTPVQRSQHANALVTLSRNTAAPLPTWTIAGTAQAALVVPSSTIPADHLTELAADLDVMCAVADRLLGDSGLKTHAWGPPINRYRRSTRSLYLPGFGALFLVEVEFPLAEVPTPDQPADPETTDALWAEMRDNLRSRGTRGRSDPHRHTLQYDNLKVQSLKRTLHRAMKHCANLRHLGPDENVIAVAIEAPQARSAARYPLRQDDPYSAYNVVQGHGAAGPAHIIAVQATKSNIDALAHGRLSAAQFEGVVKTASYQLPLLHTDLRRPRIR